MAPRSPITAREQAPGVRRPWRLPLDPVLTAAVVGLGVASVVTLRGATSNLIPTQPHYYVNRQATYLVAGVLLMLALSRVDYSRLRVERSVATGSFAVGGEIDLANVDFLEAQLWEQLRAGDVEVDCSELTFVDVSGCRLLRQACDGGMGNGRLTIRNPPPILARVMHLCDLADGVTA